MRKLNNICRMISLQRITLHLLTLCCVYGFCDSRSTGNPTLTPFKLKNVEWGTFLKGNLKVYLLNFSDVY